MYHWTNPAVRCWRLKTENRLTAWGRRDCKTQPGRTAHLRASVLCVSRRCTKTQELTRSYLPERLSPCACSRKWRGRSGGWWSSGCGHPVSSAAQRTGPCPPVSTPRSLSTAPGPPGKRRPWWGWPTHTIPPLTGQRVQAAKKLISL